MKRQIQGEIADESLAGGGHLFAVLGLGFHRFVAEEIGQAVQDPPRGFGVDAGSDLPARRLRDALPGQDVQNQFAGRRVTKNGLGADVDFLLPVSDEQFGQGIVSEKLRQRLGHGEFPLQRFGFLRVRLGSFGDRPLVEGQKVMKVRGVSQAVHREIHAPPVGVGPHVNQVGGGRGGFLINPARGQCGPTAFGGQSIVNGVETHAGQRRDRRQEESAQRIHEGQQEGRVNGGAPERQAPSLPTGRRGRLGFPAAQAVDARNGGLEAIDRAVGKAEGEVDEGEEARGGKKSVVDVEADSGTQGAQQAHRGVVEGAGDDGFNKGGFFVDDAVQIHRIGGIESVKPANQWDQSRNCRRRRPPGRHGGRRHEGAVGGIVVQNHHVAAHQGQGEVLGGNTGNRAEPQISTAEFNGGAR